MWLHQLILLLTWLLIQSELSKSLFKKIYISKLRDSTTTATLFYLNDDRSNLLPDPIPSEIFDEGFKLWNDYLSSNSDLESEVIKSGKIAKTLGDDFDLRGIFDVIKDMAFYYESESESEAGAGTGTGLLILRRLCTRILEFLRVSGMNFALRILIGIIISDNTDAQLLYDQNEKLFKFIFDLLDSPKETLRIVTKASKVIKKIKSNPSNTETILSKFFIDEIRALLVIIFNIESFLKRNFSNFVKK